MNVSVVKNNFIIDALKYLPIKILPAASGLLTIFVLTKYLSTDNYINYTFLITTLLLINQLCGGWVNSSMMYFIPKSENVSEENKLINHVFIIELIFSIVGFLILFATIYYEFNDINISLIICFIFLLQISINFINSYLQSKRLIKAQVVSTTLQSMIQIFALLIVYYYYENDLFLYLVFFSISFIVSLASLFFNKNISFDVKLAKYNKTLIVNILSFGMPLCIWFFSTQAYSVGDRILLKYFDVSYGVVNYVAFRDLATGLSGFISMPLLFASHPIIMNLVLKENNKIGAAGVIVKNINILLLTFLPCILIVYFYGQKIFLLFLGSKYILSPFQMVIVLLTILIGCISVYLQKGLEVSSKTKHMMISAIVVTITSISLNIIFIPLYGVSVSIIIGLFAQVLYSFLIVIKSNKILKIDAKKIYLPQFICFLILSFLIKFLLLDNELLITIASTFVLFFVLIICFNKLKLTFKNK